MLPCSTILTQEIYIQRKFAEVLWIGIPDFLWRKGIVFCWEQTFMCSSSSRKTSGMILLEPEEQSQLYWSALERIRMGGKRSEAQSGEEERIRKEELEEMVYYICNLWTFWTKNIYYWILAGFAFTKFLVKPSNFFRTLYKQNFF